jgi:hypothetical protein
MALNLHTTVLEILDFNHFSQMYTVLYRMSLWLSIPSRQAGSFLEKNLKRDKTQVRVV